MRKGIRASVCWYLCVDKRIYDGEPQFSTISVFFLMTSQHCNFLKMSNDICHTVKNISLSCFLTNGVLTKIKYHCVAYFTTLFLVGCPKKKGKMAVKWPILLKNGLESSSNGRFFRIFLMKTVLEVRGSTFISN